MSYEERSLKIIRSAEPHINASLPNWPLAFEVAGTPAQRDNDVLLYGFLNLLLLSVCTSETQCNLVWLYADDYHVPHS